MKLEHMKAMFSAVWVMAVVAAGLLGHVTSPVTWLILALIAVVPPLAVMRYWNYPAKTMSESIREALR